MKEDIAQRWIEALRSGEFQQGTRFLTQEIGGQQFDCCLGVLCKLAIADGVPLQMLPRSETNSAAAITFAWVEGGDEVREISILPSIVQEWSGLDTDDGELKLGGISTTLAAENDGSEDNFGRSFAQIADIIDKHWADL